MIPAALCTRCVLPDNFPGVSLEAGVCNFCRESTSATLARKKRELAVQIEQAIEAARGGGDYDCIVAFSGGKDSSYTLKLLVERYGLNCLAIMVDNGFISPQAQQNCRTVTEALGVDFTTFTPAFRFMKTMYVKSAQGEAVHTRAAIKRASAMCNSCINLINNHMMRAALHHGAPLIAGGYIGGQVPRDAAVLVLDLDRQREMRAAGLRRQVDNFGAAATRYFGLDQLAAVGRKLTVINPMLSVELGESEIIAAVSELGWTRTTDTGLNSTNCRLNDLGIAVHYQRHQFHPYVFEVAEQVRAGTMPRDEALKKVSRVPAFAELQPQIAKLELDVSTLPQ